MEKLLNFLKNLDSVFSDENVKTGIEELINDHDTEDIFGWCLNKTVIDDIKKLAKYVVFCVENKDWEAKMEHEYKFAFDVDDFFGEIVGFANGYAPIFDLLFHLREQYSGDKLGYKYFHPVDEEYKNFNNDVDAEQFIRENKEIISQHTVEKVLNVIYEICSTVCSETDGLKTEREQCEEEIADLKKQIEEIDKQWESVAEKTPNYEFIEEKELSNN